MQRRIPALFLFLVSMAGLVWGSSLENAEQRYGNGDLNGARQALTELLAEGGGTDRAAALELLGRIEVEAKRWSEALDAWSELVESHPETAGASSVAAALGPLEALAECGCGAAATDRVAMTDSPGSESATEPPAGEPASPLPAAPPAAAPRPTEPHRAPTVESAPAPAPGSAAGLILVGGWSSTFESSQEATRAMADFLEEAGVPVRFVPTDVAAARGREVTLSFLLDQAEESGARGVLFFSARFTHRDYVLAESFDPRGTLLWKEKITGGTELRPSRERGKVRWALVERMQKKLGKRIGTPDLPTQ